MWDVVCSMYCFITVWLQRATVVPCCRPTVLLSLYCIVIAFLNEINRYGDGDRLTQHLSCTDDCRLTLDVWKISRFLFYRSKSKQKDGMKAPILSTELLLLARGLQLSFHPHRLSIDRHLAGNKLHSLTYETFGLRDSNMAGSRTYDILITSLTF